MMVAVVVVVVVVVSRPNIHPPNRQVNWPSRGPRSVATANNGSYPPSPDDCHYYDFVYGTRREILAIPMPLVILAEREWDF